MNTDNIAVFKIDKTTGKLEYTGQQLTSFVRRDYDGPLGARRNDVLPAGRERRKAANGGEHVGNSEDERRQVEVGSARVLS